MYQNQFTYVKVTVSKICKLFWNTVYAA